MKKEKIILLMLGAIPFLAPVIFSFHNSPQSPPSTFSTKTNYSILKQQDKEEMNFLYSKIGKESNDNKNPPYLIK